MKRAALFIFVLALAGCTAFEHPLGGETEIAVDTRMVGRWEGDAPEGGKMQLAIQRDGRVELISIDPDSGTDKDSFRLRTVRLEGLEIANAAIEDDGKTAWQPLRYQLTGRNVLRVFLRNDETWYDAVKRGEVSGHASRGPEGPSTLVTAPGDKLLDFVRAHRDSVFVGEPVALRRMR